MRKRFLIPVLCLALLMGFSAGGLAASNEIKAILNDVLNFKVNGRDFIPLDEDGKTELMPIVYKGRTYLPVRSLARGLGVAVNLDPKTNTIYLGERSVTPLISGDYEHLWSSMFTTDQALLTINDKKYTSGIVYTGKDGSYEYSGFVYPDGDYQKFGGIACMKDSDGTTQEVVIKIREKDYQGRVLKEITLKSGESIPFEIDIPHIETLYIQNLVTDRVPKNTHPDSMMIADPYFK